VEVRSSPDLSDEGAGSVSAPVVAPLLFSSPTTPPSPLVGLGAVVVAVVVVGSASSIVVEWSLRCC